MTSVDAVPHPAPPERPELPDGAPAASDDRPRWPPWTAPVALIAGFAAALLGAIVIGIVAAIFGASLHDPPPAVGIASVIVQDACLIGSALFFARLSAGRPRPSQFGLRRPRSLWASAGLVVAAYLTFILVSYAWLQLIGQTNAKDTITEDLGAGNGTAALVAIAFVVCVLAPLAEELFFRGYFFGALRQVGLWPAVILTGLAFGLVHVFGSPVAFLLPLAFLGGLLCLLREHTRSLYPGIALHCLNNSIALSSSQHWDWQVPVVLVCAPAAIAALVWAGLRAWPGPAAAPARSTI
jgi:membrane protease YdiL (CAAX protease family)